MNLKYNADRPEGVPDSVRARADELVKRQGLRIRSLRVDAGLTIQDIADKTGLHTNTIGRIERGHSEANTEQLLLIAQALSKEPLSLMHFSDSLNVGPLDRSTVQADDDFALIEMIDVQVSAGGGSMNGHNEVIGRFAFRRDWLGSKGLSEKHAKIVRARGDSMADRINNGDILLINTAITTLGADGVYVIELDGLDYVKLIQRDFSTGGVQIISYNKNYRAQSLTSEQAANLRVCGKVVWHAGEF